MWFGVQAKVVLGHSTVFRFLFTNSGRTESVHVDIETHWPRIHKGSARTLSLSGGGIVCDTTQLQELHNDVRSSLDAGVAFKATNFKRKPLTGWGGFRV